MVWRGPSFMNALKFTKSHYHLNIELHLNSQPLVTVYFQWDSVVLEPLLHQNLSHGNFVLTACGLG